MNPESVLKSYRNMLSFAGEQVVLRRYLGEGQNRQHIDMNLSARVVGYSVSELVGPVVQGDRKVILLADDFEAAGWDAPPRKGDRMILRGKELAVDSVDDSTRRLGGSLIAYELRVRG